ncbi:MAG: hypothetical protein KGM96_08885 [Acidobacteriota bacterium]|nr:hypothetical protein [Acidobacteriota bacterium]
MKTAALIFTAAVLALSAQSAFAEDARGIVVDHSKTLTYVSEVSRSTTWTGVRVLNLGRGQCEKVSQRLIAMRHINGIDLPNIAVSRIVAPCGILGAPKKR